jgi:hypothetical protein
MFSPLASFITLFRQAGDTIGREARGAGTAASLLGHELDCKAWTRAPA